MAPDSVTRRRLASRARACAESLPDHRYAVATTILAVTLLVALLVIDRLVDRRR
jgi:hypothetical protein